MPSYYAADVDNYLGAEPAEVLEGLSRSDAASGFAQLSHNQVQAWRDTLGITREAIRSLPSQDLLEGVVLEYRIPRREKRIDCVFVGKNDVVIVEFKFGSSTLSSPALEQGIDYGLDICNYHEESREVRVHVIICPTEYQPSRRAIQGPPQLASVQVCGKGDLGTAVASCLSNGAGGMTLQRWTNSRYKPIPGILEAACLLFAGSDLGQIEKCLASSEELEDVLEYIRGQIREARTLGVNRLLLVSGVPGSGKTALPQNLWVSLASFKAVLRRTASSRSPAQASSGEAVRRAFRHEAAWNRGCSA